MKPMGAPYTQHHAMALFTLLHERRLLARARALAAEGRTTEAMATLDDLESPATDALRQALRAAAVERWCEAAERSAARGEGHRARERLTRARRYATPALMPRVQAVDRRLRAAAVRATRAEHRARLLDRAEQAAVDPAWASWTSPQLCADAAATLGLEALRPDHVDALGEPGARALRPALDARYPAALHAPWDLPFTAGVLWLALGRPDRAALPLAESDDHQPLVCFELARTAHLLGLPDIARTALYGFVARAGGHHRVRRLHTGVFLAQMQLACGDATGALATLDAVPLRLIGGRPALVGARLLLDHGRAEQAAALLDQLLSTHPDLDGAAALRDEALAAIAARYPAEPAGC
jgi:hypothetical protein